MIIDTVVIYLDWVVVWGNWGCVGVQRIVDVCVFGGICWIYW